jgi:hypothetical protein
MGRAMRLGERARRIGGVPPASPTLDNVDRGDDGTRVGIRGIHVDKGVRGGLDVCRTATTNEPCSRAGSM